VDIWGTRLATRRTFLLLRGPSVTERLRLAGNADWQEKRVLRCWPSVNGGTSGLEYGAGKPPPLNCQVLHAGSRSGPPPQASQGSLRGASVTREGVQLALPRPRPQPRKGPGQERGYNKAHAGGFKVPPQGGSTAPSGAQGRDSYWEGQSSGTAAPEAPSRGMRGQTGSEGITRLVLVGFQPLTRLNAVAARWRSGCAPA
jgi:hypothetical protein